MENRLAFSKEKEVFEQNGIPIEANRYSTKSGDVFYVKVGDDDLPSLLLIHGSPGDWTAWKQLIFSTNLLDNYRLIIPDRPAYHSTTAMGGNLQLQSSAFSHLMEKECKPCIVAGHSYGGALALQLSVDYTDQVLAVVSIAGTISAASQKPKWYNTLANISWIQNFLSDGFIASNQEMLSLSTDLNAIEDSLKEVDLPFYLLQGGKDSLVDPASPFYILSQCDNVTLVYYPDWNHFVIWNDMDGIAQYLNRVNP